MAGFKAFLAIAAAVALSGCLVSEQPLLNDANAKAKPLAPGRYEACGEDEDCKTLKITHEGALYSLEPAGEDTTMARFRALGGGAHVAQMWEEGDGSYFYFYVVKTKDGAKLSMVACDDVSEKTRARLVKSGDLEVSSDASTCTAKTLKGAERATRDYGKRRDNDSDWTVLTWKGE
jgi:hypothetical protein